MKHVWIRIEEKATKRIFRIEFAITPKYTMKNDDCEITQFFGIFFGICILSNKEFRITISRNINHPETD